MNGSPRTPSPTPPRLEPAAHGSARLPAWPLLALLALLGGLAALRVASALNLPTPLCWLRTLTGVPCLTCGSTRAALALTQGEWLQALHLNPLATLVAAGVVGAFGLWLVDSVRETSLLPRVIQTFRRSFRWPLVVAILAANWLYLILTGGR